MNENIKKAIVIGALLSAMDPQDVKKIRERATPKGQIALALATLEMISSVDQLGDSVFEDLVVELIDAMEV